MYIWWLRWMELQKRVAHPPSTGPNLYQKSYSEPYCRSSAKAHTVTLQAVNYQDLISEKRFADLLMS